MATGFTAERLAAAQASFAAFWRADSSAPLLSVYTPLVYRQQPDENVMFAQAVACIRADGAENEPAILPCLFPDFGTVSTAAMWGGRIIPSAPGRNIHIAPRVQTLAEFMDVEPGSFEGSDFQRAITLYRRVCERLETTAVFTRTPDFQGPLNTLALVVPQKELLCAFYDTPDLVHAAVGRVTDLLIATVRRYLNELGPERIVGNLWPYVSLPAALGVGITQDYMPLLSTEVYREFELPYLKRIADAFGGVFIHCCGRYRQHLQSLRDGGFKIWGLESFYPQTKVWDVYDVFGDSITYVVGVSPDGAADFPGLAAYARHISRLPCARARFWFCTDSGARDLPELRDVIRHGFGRSV